MIGRIREAKIKPEPLPNQTDNVAEALVGTWNLTSREDYTRQGDRLTDPHLGADPVGILNFSKDRFSAQFMKRDRSGDAGSEPGPQVENNSVAVNGYDAYFGTYSVTDDKAAIVVRLEGSLTPENTGQEFTRVVRVSDEQLIIRLDTATDDGVPIIRTLTFERLP
jgi:hypothetical protein